MASTNMNRTRIKPEHSELTTLTVLRREQISPHFSRVTVGGDDLNRFRFLGHDQWFRLFLPVTQDLPAKLPQKLDTLSYLKFLTISKAQRPVLRNYTVRAFRPDLPTGPELDIDFVLHGSVADGTAGPAAGWAQQCSPGDTLALLDEGISFNPDPALTHHLLVADETGLPAMVGVLDGLDRAATGVAVIELQHTDDRQPVNAPDGVEVEWVVRGSGTRPGAAALAAVTARPQPTTPFHGWVVGEQSLATGLRRHWVAGGASKQDISFTGYWRLGKGH